MYSQCQPDTNLYHDVVECIMGALDARDPDTAGHSQRVSDMSVALCRAIGLPEERVVRIHIAAHLHDIGKIGIPDSVLKKPGKLEKDEWETMKQHSVIGADILEKAHHLRSLAVVVRHHHERWDGTGYPDGLKGEEIPYGSRIIALCDSIDAILSVRRYRNAHDEKFCYDEIEKNLGIMYDPEIGRILLHNWNDIIEARNKFYSEDGCEECEARAEEE